MNEACLLLAVVGGTGTAFLGRRWFLERGHGVLRAMRPADLATGVVTNFLDPLGIGDLAPTTDVGRRAVGLTHPYPSPAGSPTFARCVRSATRLLPPATG